MSQLSEADRSPKMQSEIKAPVLYIANLIQSTGASLLWPITTLYMHNELGESMTNAGIVLMAMSLLMMLGSWLGGRLFDRWNPYLSMVFAVFISLLDLIALTFFHDWPIFAILLSLLGFTDGIIYALLNAFAASIKSTDLRRVFNMQYLFLNVGVVVGTAGVGFIFNHGIAFVFAAASLMYAGFLYMVIRYFKIEGLQRRANLTAHTKRLKLHWPRLVYALLGLVFAIYMGYVLWETVVASHMVAMGLSTEQYSFLWTLNGLIIIAGGILLDRVIVKIPFKVSVLGGSFLFAISFIGLIFAHSYWNFIFAFIILTIGEMFVSPQVPAWIDRISSPEARGQAQGLITMFISLGRALGPVYGGLMIDHGSYNILFASIFVIITAFIGLAWLLSKPKLN